MISMNYEKPEIDIVEFELEDVLTASAVVHTTKEHTTTMPTTLPGTTTKVEVGTGDSIIVDYSDFFQ